MTCRPKSDVEVRTNLGRYEQNVGCDVVEQAQMSQHQLVQLQSRHQHLRHCARLSAGPVRTLTTSP
jgi:hypothetical protein